MKPNITEAIQQQSTVEIIRKCSEWEIFVARESAIGKATKQMAQRMEGSMLKH